MEIKPRYTPENCSAAYQLNWSLSVFGRESLPSPACTIEELREAIANDHLKILEFKYNAPNIAQFFVSARPNSKPSDIVRLVKGRWQYLSRQFHDEQVDLTCVRRSSHGEFRCAMQVVIESESGWHDVRANVLTAYRQAIILSCRKHGWLRRFRPDKPDGEPEGANKKKFLMYRSSCQLWPPLG